MLDISGASITGVLNKIGVHNQVIGGDGKQVAVCIKVATGKGSTLPLPNVIGIATETVEADQVDTATALKIELAAPLIQDLVKGVG